MSKSVITHKKTAVLGLKADSYEWCCFRQSYTLNLCDSFYQGIKLTLLAFEETE